MEEKTIKLNSAQLLQIKGGNGDNNDDDNNISYDLDRVVDYNGIEGG